MKSRKNRKTKNFELANQDYGVLEKINSWSYVDDNLLIKAAEKGLNKKEIADTVKFSIPFSEDDIEDRWREILYEKETANAVSKAVVKLLRSTLKRTSWTKREETIIKKEYKEKGYMSFPHVLSKYKNEFHPCRTVKTMESHFWSMKKKGMFIDVKEKDVQKILKDQKKAAEEKEKLEQAKLEQEKLEQEKIKNGIKTEQMKTEEIKIEEKNPEDEIMQEVKTEEKKTEEVKVEETKIEDEIMQEATPQDQIMQDEVMKDKIQDKIMEEGGIVGEFKEMKQEEVTVTPFEEQEKDIFSNTSQSLNPKPFTKKISEENSTPQENVVENSNTLKTE